jgi:hypothetical protein
MYLLIVRGACFDKKVGSENASNFLGEQHTHN